MPRCASRASTARGAAQVRGRMTWVAGTPVNAAATVRPRGGSLPGVAALLPTDAEIDLDAERT